MKDLLRMFTRVYNNRWFQVFLSFLALLCLGTVYSYSILRIEIEKEFSIGSGLSGIPYLTSLFFYALTMFISGRYLSRFSPTKIMLIGSILVSIGWILSGLASNIIFLTITYGLIMGVGVGLLYGIPILVIPKWFIKGNKGLAVGLILAGFGLSPLITSPLTQLSLDNSGLSSTFVSFGVAFGIVLPIISLLFHNPKEESTPLVVKVKKDLSIENSNKSIVKTKNFWLLYLNFLFGTTTGLMIIGSTGLIGTQYYNIEIHIIAFTISAFAFSNAIGRPIFGTLNDYLGTKKAISLIHIITIISSGIIILNPFNSFFVFLLGFAPLWMMLGAWLAIAPAATYSLFGETNYPRNYGIIFTGYGFGAIIGVLFSSRVFDVNLSLDFIFIPIIIISSVILFLSLMFLGNSSNSKE